MSLSLSDYWVQSLLNPICPPVSTASSSTTCATSTPSPVPSCTSASSTDDVDVVTKGPSDATFGGLLAKTLPVRPMATSFPSTGMLDPSLFSSLLWQPDLLHNLLAICQLQQAVQAIQTPPTVTQSARIAPGPTPELLKHLSLPALSPLENGRKRAGSLNNEFHQKKPKLRKLEDDTVTASPVSGMFIKEESDVRPVDELQKEADLLDETAAYVVVSDESRRRIAEIHNVIGDCICRLCKVKYDDVFKLAQHRCPRIAHEEYKCPECDKIFSCPANLASHRRWHKPRDATTEIQRCASCTQPFATKKQYKQHLAHCQNIQRLFPSVIPNIQLEMTSNC